jgi:TM2 domain-containing membrane protein YozV
VATGARKHSPLVALVSGIVVPGAGQSYNGKPFFGFLLLIFSPLLVPWVYGFVEAHQGARKIEAAGGRIGRGGWPWVGLHAWLALDFALFIMIVLTMRGVLS